MPARSTTSATPAPSRSPSFLELVRLGVKPASSPLVRNTLGVVDKRLGVDTPNGRFWHRYDFDGYGEKKDGSNWDIGQPVNPTENWANNATIGRIWPIFAGERGEYELLSGDRASARGRLGSIAATAGPGHMIAEQVWDMNFDSDTNVVDVAVRRLRAKIDDTYPDKLIHTVRGVGYVLREP